MPVTTPEKFYIRRVDREHHGEGSGEVTVVSEGMPLESNHYGESVRTRARIEKDAVGQFQLTNVSDSDCVIWKKDEEKEQFHLEPNASFTLNKLNYFALHVDQSYKYEVFTIPAARTGRVLPPWMTKTRKETAQTEFVVPPAKKRKLTTTTDPVTSTPKAEGASTSQFKIAQTTTPNRESPSTSQSETPVQDTPTPSSITGSSINTSMEDSDCEKPLIIDTDPGSNADSRIQSDADADSTTHDGAKDSSSSKLSSEQAPGEVGTKQHGSNDETEREVPDPVVRKQQLDYDAQIANQFNSVYEEEMEDERDFNSRFHKTVPETPDRPPVSPFSSDDYDYSQLTVPSTSASSDPVGVRMKCKYAEGCYRVKDNKEHAATFSHPGDYDWDIPLPACRYGRECYQQNELHRSQYGHPPGTTFTRKPLKPKQEKPKERKQALKRKAPPKPTTTYVDDVDAEDSDPSDLNDDSEDEYKPDGDDHDNSSSTESESNDDDEGEDEDSDDGESKDENDDEPKRKKARGLEGRKNGRRLKKAGRKNGSREEKEGRKNGKKEKKDINGEVKGVRDGRK